LPDRLVAPPREGPADVQGTCTAEQREARDSTEQEKRLRDLESRCQSLEGERDKAVLEKRLSELEERCELLKKERDVALQAAEDAKRVEEETKQKMKTMAGRVKLALSRLGDE
jgi:TolA-binding protein